MGLWKPGFLKIYTIARCLIVAHAFLSVSADFQTPWVALFSCRRANSEWIVTKVGSKYGCQQRSLCEERIKDIRTKKHTIRWRTLLVGNCELGRVIQIQRSIPTFPSVFLNITPFPYILTNHALPCLVLSASLLHSFSTSPGIIHARVTPVNRPIFFEYILSDW